MLRAVTTKWAVQWALKWPPPDASAIPRSGKKAAGINCYLVHLDAKDEKLLLHAADRKGVKGKEFPITNESPTVEVSWADAADRQIELIHFVGPYEFRYRSALGFLAQEIVNYPRYAILKNRVEQYFFNRRRLSRFDSIDLLRYLVDKSIKEPDFEASATCAFSELYSDRAWAHPMHDQLLRYVRYLMDSLVASEDLSRAGHNYKLKPSALSTLARYEEEERRHQDTVRQSARLMWLTVVLALIGMAQVGATVYSSRQSQSPESPRIAPAVERAA